jgi:DNA-binding transcriptional LysR family regulator
MDNMLVVLGPIHHPLAGERNIALSRIANEPFLIREHGSGTRIAVERLFKEQGLSINVRMELGSNEAIKQSIVGGLGISVLSRHTLALDAAMGQLTILDVQNFPIKRQWHVAYPTGKQLTTVAQTFLEYLRHAAEVVEDIPCHYAEQAGGCPLITTQTKSVKRKSREK